MDNANGPNRANSGGGPAGNRPPWSLRDFIRSAVVLWGDRGPQPLFDVISTLCTICPAALACVGVHASSSVSMATNDKVPRALVPVCSDEVVQTLLPAGRVSVCPRDPLDTGRFLSGFYRRYLDGELTASDIDPRARSAIHILDMDFTDPDNTCAMLCLVQALDKCSQNGEGTARHPLFVFVSRRKMSSQLAPSQRDEGDAGGGGSGNADEEEAAQRPAVRFLVNDGTVPPTSYVITDSVAPYIKEGPWESAYHCQDDMQTFGIFAHSILSKHLSLAGMRHLVRLGVNGSFEIAGVSSNVHKLEWFFFNNDGTYVDAAKYNADVKAFWNAGLVSKDAGGSKDHSLVSGRGDGTTSNRNPGSTYGGVEQNLERQRLFREKCAQYILEDDEMTDLDALIKYLRNQEGTDAEDKSAGAGAGGCSLPEIFVHCAGPMFILNELAKHDDLRKRVARIGSMFLAHDGSANLLGKNFNEGVAANLTEKLWGEDGQNIHRLFPNAELLCVTTETCKAEGLSFVPPPASQPWQPREAGI